MSELQVKKALYAAGFRDNERLNQADVSLCAEKNIDEITEDIRRNLFCPKCLKKICFVESQKKSHHFRHKIRNPDCEWGGDAQLNLSNKSIQRKTYTIDIVSNQENSSKVSRSKKQKNTETSNSEGILKSIPYICKHYGRLRNELVRVPNMENSVELGQIVRPFTTKYDPTFDSEADVITNHRHTVYASNFWYGEIEKVWNGGNVLNPKYQRYVYLKTDKQSKEYCLISKQEICDKHGLTEDNIGKLVLFWANLPGNSSPLLDEGFFSIIPDKFEKYFRV